jgi:hypothetical protein
VTMKKAVFWDVAPLLHGATSQKTAFFIATYVCLEIHIGLCIPSRIWEIFKVGKAIRRPVISKIIVECTDRFKIYVILADWCLRRVSKTRIFTHLKVQILTKNLVF